jgi:multidrug efflux system membrane fusion protein
MTMTSGRRIGSRLAAAVLALAAGASLGLGGCNGQKEAAAPQGPPPAVPVSVATVVEKTVPIEIRTFGAVEANLTAAIKAQIGGLLTEVHFTEGRMVRKGEPLFTIDPRPYEAALQIAEANLSRDTAQYDTAQKEWARQEELLKKGVVSQGEDDIAKAAFETLGAAIRSDNAAIERAKLDIGYCKIEAPFDGRAGAWMVDKGNLVKANDIPLVNINQIQPIQVSVSVPEGELLDIQKAMASHKVVVKAIPPNQADQPEIGELTFIDNTVDRTAGTIRLKATFPNEQQRLWPGLYVDIVLVLSEEPNALVIPSRAIQSGQKGDYVYVVGPDMKVMDRVVTISRRLGGDTVISDGLKAGEIVVMDSLKLKPGSQVEIMKPVDEPAAADKGPSAEKPSAKPGPAEAPASPAKGEGARI